MDGPFFCLERPKSMHFSNLFELARKVKHSEERETNACDEFFK